ncbi:universal stress protein [Desertivirga xinjiangensis]|uniref:universal stress protein n=1 Tax=Desertivirga xinjiangensis TaxID=539206 RepID=UPI0021088EA4|nr:universal stress protein [Pedobacter xinjiangensis]
MKKVIAAFDGLKFSESTLEYAIEIVKNSSGLLVGISLEDFTYHSYSVFDIVGSEGVSAEKAKLLRDKDRKTRRESVQHFLNACHKANIKTKIHRDKSLAIQELLKETIYSDLLIISQQETLTHIKEEPPTRFIRDLLTDIQCPVLIVPKVYSRTECIIVLYNGAPSSVYAAKMFSYMLPHFKDLPIEVVTVKTDSEEMTIPESALIREFVDCHFPDANIKVLHGDPEIEIVKHLEAKQNSLVVLGAYQRNMVARWFRPSMADSLMRNMQLPLFIAHYKT